MLSLLIILLLAVCGLTMFVDAVVSQPAACETLVSSLWRNQFAEWLGARTLPEGQLALPLERVFALASGSVLLAWVSGSVLLRWFGRCSWKEAAQRWGCWGGLWCIACGAWWAVWLTLRLMNWSTCAGLIESQSNLFIAVVLSGGVATWTALVNSRDGAGSHWAASSIKPSERTRSLWPTIAVVAVMLVYTAVYFTLNARLYQNLLVPHGDSAMYEEHLWNLEHGKGFRSYLDAGLFLGEHIQVIHILLVPLHLIWPSHLTLELCQSAALALAAWPVFLITRRHTGSDRIGVLLAIAYLFYGPMQYLDIAIDQKTFRPTALGIAPLLMAIDALERARYRRMALWMLVALSAQEDFAIPIGCLGAWLAATNALAIWKRRRSINVQSTEAATFNGIYVGATVLVVSVVYLLVAVKWVIPWFHGSETVHYTRYFPQFGETPTEIVWNMLTKPKLLYDELFTRGMLAFTLHLLVPLGFASLLSPSRLLVGVPLWVLLCLNTLAHDPYLPVHHFHAPLIPILVWSAIAGVGNAGRIWEWLRRRHSATSPGSAFGTSLVCATFVMCCSVFCNLFEGVGPQSLQFWDAGRAFYWRNNYVIGDRARLFEIVEAQIPASARVASTDFVHPRFTHHERSYDYSLYERAVAGNTTRVPEDTDYIVIDTGHRYSWIHSPAEVRELREEPEKWELLPDETEGYFIVLRRGGIDL